MRESDEGPILDIPEIIAAVATLKGSQSAEIRQLVDCIYHLCQNLLIQEEDIETLAEQIPGRKRDAF